MRCELLAIVLTFCFLGCEPPKSQPAAPPGSLPAGAIQSNATGVWNQSQVELFVNEDLKLTTLTLRSTGNNGFEGTGTDAEGIAYTLKIKQVAGGICVDWTHSTGNGKITFGNPVP